MERGSAPIDGPRPPLLFGQITGEVIGAFFEVHTALRFGFLESAYAGALAVELAERGLSCKREQLLHVRYHDQIVGVYRADFVVEGVLILELKTMSRIGHPEKRQLLHYLRATDMRIGLILNFGPEASFLRVINS
jgi:GxxExxY protein